MSWSGVVTNQGQAILAALSQGSHTLTIDTPKVGSGTTAPEDMREATALNNYVANAVFAGAKSVSGGTQLKVQIGPAPSTAYACTEVGIYGHIDNESSVLISLHQDDGDGVSIPTAAASPDFAFGLFITLAVANDSSLSITVDPTAYVSASTFNALVANVPIENGTGDGSAKTKDYTVSNQTVSQTASGKGSFAHGGGTVASGNFSHAEGGDTTASGGYSHAEGYETVASGGYSHAEGRGTVANHKSQTAVGEYNVPDPSENASSARGNYAFIVGNGPHSAAKSNAMAIDWDGNMHLNGDLLLQCDNDSTGGIALRNYAFDSSDLSALSSYPTKPGIYRTSSSVTGLPSSISNYTGTLIIIKSGSSLYSHLYFNATSVSAALYYGVTTSTDAPSYWRKLPIKSIGASYVSGTVSFTKSGTNGTVSDAYTGIYKYDDIAYIEARVTGMTAANGANGNYFSVDSDSLPPFITPLSAIAVIDGVNTPVICRISREGVISLTGDSSKKMSELYVYGTYSLRG